MMEGVMVGVGVKGEGGIRKVMSGDNGGFRLMGESFDKDRMG